MIKHLTLPKKMAAMVLLAGAALSIAPVQAASYPTKQIELVVPYAAGGGTDLVARAFAASRLSQIRHDSSDDNRR